MKPVTQLSLVLVLGVTAIFLASSHDVTKPPSAQPSTSKLIGVREKVYDLQSSYTPQDLPVEVKNSPSDDLGLKAACRETGDVTFDDGEARLKDFGTAYLRLLDLVTEPDLE